MKQDSISLNSRRGRGKGEQGGKMHKIDQMNYAYYKMEEKYIEKERKKANIFRIPKGGR